MALAAACLGLAAAATPARAQPSEAAGAAGPSAAARATDTAASDAQRRLDELLTQQRSLGERLAADEQRLRQQESRLAEQQLRLVHYEARLTAAPPHEPLGVQLGLGPDGFFLGTRESGFQLRLRGVIQADGRAFFDTSPTAPLPDQFLIRRARPIIEGTVADVFEFRLLPEFGQGVFQLLDAWIDLRPWKWLALRGGKFKTPFGLERLQQEQFLLFVERGLTQNLVPDRDIGLSLHGNVGDGALLYEAGVFNGTTDGGNVDGDSNDGKDLVVRLFSHPFHSLHAEAFRGFGIGIAATWGKQHGNLLTPGLPQYKTSGQNTFFSFLLDPLGVKPSVIAISDRYRVSPQFNYYAGPVGVLGEYVYSATTVTNNAGTTQPRTLVANQAWQLQASVVLTGEHASYEGVDPKRPFNLKQRHFGAVEVAARYGELRVNDVAFPNYADPNKSARAALEWGVQANWHLTRLVKIALFFARTTFKGGAPMGGDRQPENALIGRWQVAF